MYYLSRGLEATGELDITDINLRSVNDGVYRGSYQQGRFSNEIEVEIEEGEIIRIDVVDDVTFSRGEVTEELKQEILAIQSLDVDTVSGATVICKAYLKVLEDALSGAGG